MACDNLLTYPDFNEMLKIHTNASAFQLGAVIIQKGTPITFYSRKLIFPTTVNSNGNRTTKYCRNPEGVYNNTTWLEITNIY